MKILIFGGKAGLKNRIDNNLYKFLTFVQKHSKYEILDWIENEKKLYEILDNNKNNKIIIYFICSNPVLKKKYDNVIRVIDIIDIQCRCRYKCLGDKKCNVRNKMKNIDSDYIIFRYDTYLTKNIFNKSRQFILNHFVDSQVFYDRKLEKKYDLLFYGNNLSVSYPFRNRLLKIFRENKRKFNIKLIEFSRRKRDMKTLVHGNELAKLINQSWITISTKSVSNFLLQRYYEVGLSKSVICGDFPDLETDIEIKNNMILIDNSMSDDKILDIIQNNLKDKKNLKDLSEKTHNHFVNNYTFNHGLIKFDKIFTKIINENK